ncbi:MAG: DNA translocase FtsK 4TM domain-containing protein, partial [Rhodobacterales bacterium]|nr:DNA translocase FtsK 4TM domain-containing protein [Rhodobacterales bacterium]
MASYQTRQRDPLLDQSMQAMLERRGKELVGLVLVALAVAVAAMLATYTPEDPGWMVATDEPAQNALGRFGAAAASTLIVIIGLGAWGIPPVFLIWGLRFLLHRGEDRAAHRIVFAVLAVALGAIFAASHVPGPGWTHAFGLGGLFGDTVLGATLEVLPIGAGLGLRLLSVATGLGTLALYLFVTGFEPDELRAIGRFLMVGLIVTYATLVSLAG